MKDYNLKYQYVYFNATYVSHGKVDPNEYNAICLRDATQMKDVIVVQCPLDYTCNTIRKIHYLHNSPKLAKYIKLPFKKLWYPYIFKKNKNCKKPYCFVVATTSLSIDYLHYLKDTYKDCKIVKIHRDLLKVCYRNSEYNEDAMRALFDKRFSFDKGEAEQFGMSHFTEIESKVDIPISKDYPLSDVFFAGRAKDRLTKLIEAYDLFSSVGLKCEFYITNVPKDEQIQREGITYSDTFMPYMDMLYKSVNTRCMFDINQEGAVGYTSRFLEAVMYNKLFITDNPTVLETKFYNQEFIKYFKKISDIDPNFVKKDVFVDYKYNNEFSPINLILQIDKELNEDER